MTKKVFIQEGNTFAFLQVSEFLINTVLRMSKIQYSSYFQIPIICQSYHFGNLICPISILKRIKKQLKLFYLLLLIFSKHIADSHVLLHTVFCYFWIILAQITLLQIHARSSLTWVIKDCGHSRLGFLLLAHHPETDWLSTLDAKILST